MKHKIQNYLLHYDSHRLASSNYILLPAVGGASATLREHPWCKCGIQLRKPTYTKTSGQREKGANFSNKWGSHVIEDIMLGVLFRYTKYTHTHTHKLTATAPGKSGLFGACPGTNLCVHVYGTSCTCTKQFLTDM